MKTVFQEVLAPGRVDSPPKLQLLLLFHLFPKLCSDARSLSERLHKAPWEMEETLDGLVLEGWLVRKTSAGPCQYALADVPRNLQLLARLASLYDDPFCREQIIKRLHEVDRERQFRAWLRADAHNVGAVTPFGLQAVC